eukprot:7283978-Lingulodinium_polyedra.AAC.1
MRQRRCAAFQKRCATMWLNMFVIAPFRKLRVRGRAICEPSRQRALIRPRHFAKVWNDMHGRG